LAWLATTVFLDLNGFQPELSDEEAFNLVWAVAASSIEFEAIALNLRIAGDASA
jgi:death-on-curing protein